RRGIGTRSTRSRHTHVTRSPVESSLGGGWKHLSPHPGWGVRRWTNAEPPRVDSNDGPGACASRRFRAPARAAAPADRLGRRGRARGAGGVAREAVDQEGVEGLRAGARDPDDGSDDARGRGHGREGRGPVVEGRPARPGRARDSLRGRPLRLPEPRTVRGRAASRHRRQGGLRRNGVPVRAGAARREAPRGRGGRRDGRGRGRHGDRPRRVPLRPLREGLRRGRAREGGVRRRAPEGDPRGRRARDVRQRAPGIAAGDGGWRRLRQYVDREAASRGDAAGDAVHARGDPGRPRRDRAGGRDEAGGRDPAGEAGGPVPRPDLRDARPRLADARPLPPRRLVAPERRPDSAPQGEDGPLPEPGLLHGRLSLAMPSAGPRPGQRRRAGSHGGAVRYRRSDGAAAAPGRFLVTDIERRQVSAPVPAGWDYAPAPEARDVVTIEERYGLFVGGEFVEPRSGDWYTTISPASEEPLAEVAQAGEDDVGVAVAAAREAFENGWPALPPSERAKYLFRIARILQERSREFAVLESLNGGKPIKESRDVDLPLAAAHFFYYAGWADKLEYAFPNRRRSRRSARPQAAGRRR